MASLGGALLVFLLADAGPILRAAYPLTGSGLSDGYPAGVHPPGVFIGLVGVIAVVAVAAAVSIAVCRAADITA